MLQGLQCRPSMGAGPENLSAFRAQFEVGLGSEDIYGNLIAYGFMRDIRKDFVARKTTGQGTRKFFDSCDAQYLFDLILEMPAFQIYEILYGFSNLQPGITRQQDATFVVGQCNQFVIGEPVGIENVESGDTQPLRQFPQHYIRNEPRSFAGIVQGGRYLGPDLFPTKRSGFSPGLRVSHFVLYSSPTLSIKL